MIRERGGDTLPAVFKTEAAAQAFIKAHIHPGTVVNADEASSWDKLHARYEMKRINHSEAYSLDGACTNWAEEYFWDALDAQYETKRINHSECYSDGNACTNMAESFFSRLRRAELGTHHHIAGRYLHLYAGEMGWREDARRVSNGEQFLAATGAALGHPVSRTWKGYSQRHLKAA